MTHQYCASDFASLPKPALDALGVRVDAYPTVTGHIVRIVDGTDTHFLNPGRTAELLIGMVQAKCIYYECYENADLDEWVCSLTLDAGGSARGIDDPTPLAAVMAAYAKAVQG